MEQQNLWTLPPEYLRRPPFEKLDYGLHVGEVRVFDCFGLFGIVCLECPAVRSSERPIIVVQGYGSLMIPMPLEETLKPSFDFKIFSIMQVGSRK